MRSTSKHTPPSAARLCIAWALTEFVFVRDQGRGQLPLRELLGREHVWSGGGLVGSAIGRVKVVVLSPPPNYNYVFNRVMMTHSSVGHRRGRELCGLKLHHPPVLGCSHYPRVLHILRSGLTLYSILIVFLLQYR